MNALEKNVVKTAKKDYLWLQIKEMPYFRGLLRAVEARVYQDIQLERPIWVVGMAILLQSPSTIHSRWVLIPGQDLLN